jgi:hypothetical protein
MSGGLGNDIFRFGAAFGVDRISDFDADFGGGGQDRMDISALGITAANFASLVSIKLVNVDGLPGSTARWWRSGPSRSR